MKEPIVILLSINLPSKTTKLDFEGDIVKADFNCASTKIKSLRGAPKHVDGWFGCSNTNITSLKGAPSYIGGDFYCHTAPIESLHNVHKIIKYIGGKFVLPVDITSHVLGIMYIKGLKDIEFYHSRDIEQDKVKNIINKHLAGDRNIHDCQEELLEAGLTEFAKL